MTATPAGEEWEGARRQRRAPWLVVVLLAVVGVAVVARLVSVADRGRLEVGGEDRAGSEPVTEGGEAGGPGTGGRGGGIPAAGFAAGAWVGAPDPPVAWVRPPSIVWTGREVLVWGATVGGAAGAAFDPVARTWRMLPEAPIGARDGHVAVWTGARPEPGAPDPAGTGEMILWGGRALLESPQEARGGAAYDPATDRWRVIAEGPLPVRSGAHATWTGTHLLVAVAPRGGSRAGSTAGQTGEAPRPVAAAYDPAGDAWEPLPALPPGTWLDGLAWTGSETLALLGQPGRQELVPAATWEPDLGLWVPRPAVPVGVAASVSTVATGAAPVLWVRSPDGAGRLALLDPGTGRWTLSARAPLRDRTSPSLVWTGRHVIVWGGADARGRLADGALYDMAGERWLRIDGAAPAVTRPLAAVWAGGEMIVVGYRGRDRQGMAAMAWAPAPGGNAR